MIRHHLKKMEEFRGEFTGTFKRIGIKSGWHGVEMETILLTNIHNNKGRFVTDHPWFNRTKGFQKLKLKEGDIVKFHARVKPYLKGYGGRYEQEIDYKLSYPTKIEII